MEKIDKYQDVVKHYTNWGSYDVWVSPDLGLVSEWKTGRIVKRFQGETAWSDAERWATDLHFVHDIGQAGGGR